MLHCKSHDGSMGRTVYLVNIPYVIFMVNVARYIYIPYMDPMGLGQPFKTSSDLALKTKIVCLP